MFRLENNADTTIINADVLLYCDDLNNFLVIREQNDADTPPNDLDSLKVWADKWNLKLCAVKCFHLCITYKKQPIPLRFSISGSELDLVCQIRDLGVILDTQLSFDNHVDSVVERGNRALGLRPRHRG